MALNDDWSAIGNPVSSSDDWSAIGAPVDDKKPQKSGIARRVLGDTAISALKGAVSVPEAVVGLADIATGGYAGKAAEGIGFRPKEAKAFLDEMYSPEQQAANKYVQEADGFTDTIKRGLQTPSVIGHSVVESLPLLLPGAAAARGISAAAKVAPWAAGAIGEGIVGAGSAAEQIRQQTDDGLLDGNQMAAAAASGLGTAGFGALGGKIAGSKIGQKLGIVDVDTALAGGGVSNAANAGIAKRVAGGMVSEGLLEEFPQSMWEQAAQNYAMDKPLDEGVANAGAMGLLAGGAMGGGFNAMQLPQDKPKLEETGALSRAVNAGIDSGATSLDAAEQFRQRADVIPAGSFGQMNEFADLVNSEQADLANRREAVRDTIPYERTSVPSSLSLAAEAQRQDGIPFEGSKPQAPDWSIQGNGSFADQAELANLIESEKSDVGQRRAEVTNKTNAARAERSQQAIAGDMAQDELAPKPVSPLEKLIASRTDEQLARLTGAGQRKEVQQAAIAEMQRRMRTPAQPTTTAPQQQESTQFNIPENINAAQPAQVPTQAPQANDAQARVEPSAAQEGVEGTVINDSRITAESTGLNGTTVYDGKGTPYRVHSHRNHLVTAHPIVDGKAQVNRDSSVRFWVTPDRSPSGENDRIDPIYTAPPVKNVNESRGPAPIAKRDDLVGAIMRVTGGKGIAANQAQTIVGDKANAATKVRGLFTNDGTADLGDVAMLLRDDEGYSVKDGEHLSELIREQAAGNPVHSMERTEREASANAEKEYKASVNQKATELGLKKVGGKRTLQVVEADILAKEQEIKRLESEAERQAIQTADILEDGEVSEAEFMRLVSQNVGYTEEEINAEAIRSQERADRKAETLSRAAADEQAQGSSSEGDGDQSPTQGTSATEAGTRSTEGELASEDIVRRAKALGMKTAGVSADRLAKQVEEAEARNAFDLTKQTNDQASAEFKRQQEEANKNDEEPAPDVTADQVDMWNTQGSLIDNNRGETKQATTEDDRVAKQLVNDFRSYPTQVLSSVINNGDAAALYKAAGVRSADAFTGLPISDQAKSYAKFVQDGGKKAEGLPSDYNEWVRSQENDAESRRMQSERTIRQANGKPFKTEYGAKQVVDRYNLGKTHDVVPVDGGYELKQLSPAAQMERQRKADGKESYIDAQEAVMRQLGIEANGDGEYDLSDAQWADVERRVDARLRGNDESNSETTPSLNAADSTNSQPQKAQDRISDFGEKLEGAKKDLWKTYQKAMSDALPSDAKDITLSKHFPEPNYENLIVSGLDIRSVAAIKAMRDEIPAKPRVSYRLTRWAGQLKTLRDFSNDIISGKQDIDHVLSEMRKVRGLSELAERIELYAELGYPEFKQASGYRVSSGWNKLDENMKVVKEDVYGVTDSRGRVTMYDTRQAAIDALRAKLSVEPESTGRSIKLDIYKVTTTGDIVIGKKVASNKYIDLKTGFKTAREAREYLKEHEAELLELLEKRKKVQPTRRSVNDPRVGKDYRQGEDVTPEKFAGEFGFRGVQFGNYVEQSRRPKDLNNAYDALLDLANTLGIPPRAVSLNGSLGLAFGARGAGGVDPAAAHYEPDQIVINLTKMNGAGSLGHEWLHALDNYFSRARGKNDGFLSAMPYERGDGVRPEVVKAFAELMKVIKESGFAKRSKELDNRRSKDYWGTSEELSARAFEAYLIAKAEENGESNDYLANIVSEEAHKIFNEMQAEFAGQGGEPYPYPTREEMQKIAPKFDNLFSTLKTKETEQGTALYSKGNAQGEAITQPAAEKRILSLLGDKLGQVLLDSGIVTFTHKGNAYQGATYTDGTIALNLDNLTADNFDGVFQHEGFHSSIKELVGQETYTKLMKQLDNLLKMGKGSQWVQDAKAAVPKNTAPENVTEEIGAYSIEQYVNGAKLPNVLQRWAQSFLSAIRAAIIQHMPNGKLKNWAIANISAQDLSKLAIAGLKAKAAGQLQAQGREAMAYSQDGDKEVPYSIVSGNEIDSAAGDTIQRKATNWMRANLQGKSFKNDDKGWDISVGRKGINKSMMHAANEIHSRSVAAIPALLKNAILVASEENRNVEERSDIPLVHHFYAPLRVNGSDYIARLVVKETRNGQRFYDYETSDEISPAIQEATHTFTQRRGVANGARLTMSMDKLLSHVKKEHGGTDPKFSKINQTDTEAFRKWFGNSAVVDANGEPLVVYHGSDVDFNIFERGKNKAFDPRGFYFSPFKEGAESYSARGTGFVKQVYLSIKNPYVAKSYMDVSKMSKERIADLEAKGYDGAYYKPDLGKPFSYYYQEEWVAFRAEQIKSATDNAGSFDANNPDIRYSKAAQIIGDSGRPYDQTQRDFFKNVGRDINPQTRIEKAADYLKNDFWKKMAIGIVDQFRGLRDLNDNGQSYMLARLSKGTAGAFDALLHHGKLSLKDGVYDADTSGGFVERLGVPLNGELDDVLWWIAANRAEGLAAQGKENLFSPQDIAAGKSLATGKTKFDYTMQTGPLKGKTTRDRAAIYADANRVFNEFQKNTLDMAEQSGLIDGASRQYWESEFYVPFYRVSEEDGEFIGSKMGNALVRQQAFKKLKGGTDKLNSDLLSNTLLNWSHLIEASAKNRAAKASLTAAEKIGAAQRVASNMGEYAASNGTILPPGTKKTAWFQDKGQKQEYLVTDPFVMTAITSLEYAGMRNGIMDVLTKFKHYLAIGVTASPAFKVRNLIRDSIQAIGTSDLSYNPIKNVTEGFKQTKRDSQEYVSALASGGLIRFGTMLEGSESSRVRQLIKAGVKDSTILNTEDKWQAFYDQYLDPAISAYNELGNRSEEINRAALYNQLIKQGKSHAEAALLARDLMDFSMQGSFNTIRFLTQVVPFANARLQGLYKLGRAAKDNPRKMAVVTGAVALASIALMMAYGDDDDWKRREDFDRDGNWWFKFGGIEWRIPKPFEIGAVASLAERSVELLTNDEMTGERFRKIVSDLVMNNLSMNPIPQAIKPIVDLYANKDSFTGRPIETMGMQRLEKTERFNSNTSMVGRGLSNATMGALSPVQYDHLARAYFGWLGSFVVGGADMAVRAVSDEPTKPARDYFKFASQGIMREEGTGSSRYLTMVYEQAAELEQAHATYRQMIKDGKIEAAKEYATDNADKLSRYRSVENVKRAESKLNEQIRMIERGNMEPDQKKVAIERIQKQKELIAKRIAPGLQ